MMVEKVDGGKVYVHLDWIDSINGYKCISQKSLGGILTKITSEHAINLKTGELTLLSSLPICDCGNLGTTPIDDGIHICQSCVDDAVERKSYLYKPTYKFIGTQLTNDKASPVWYGMEVEISTDKNELAKFAIKNRKGAYLKSDSSIRGDGYAVEIVTMPHSFSELMQRGGILDDLGKLSTNDSDANGTHVHISRTAFVDDKHYSLFYFLIHKMVDVATLVGGRELSEEYCALKPSGKVFSKAKDTKGGDRTIFLNETNIDTVEARFFKGTTDTSKLKAYVQFLESLIKYTRYHAKTVTAKKWFEYVTKKSKKYNELIEVLGTMDNELLKAEVTYREAIKTTRVTDALLIRDIPNIIELTTTRGKILNKVTQASISGSLLCYRNNGTQYETQITSIASAVLEE